MKKFIDFLASNILIESIVCTILGAALIAISYIFPQYGTIESKVLGALLACAGISGILIHISERRSSSSKKSGDD